MDLNKELTLYEIALQSIEWKNKRTSIIERDNFSCVRCGRTNSVFVRNKQVSFQTHNKIDTKSVIYSNFCIDTIKMKLGIKSIGIHRINNRFFGISDVNDYLFLINDFDALQKAPKEQIVVNSCSSQTGDLFYLLGLKNIRYSNFDFSIPFFSSESLNLQVHHKYYLKEKILAPWDYEDDALITLCNECHVHTHNVSEIPIFTLENGIKKRLMYKPCSRCNGVGYFKEFKIVENGICFKCRGARYEELITTNEIS